LRLFANMTDLTKAKEDETYSNNDNANSYSKEIWPSLFNTREKTHFLEISQDRRTIKYTGKGLHSHDVGTARTEHPFPSNRLIVYYEVTIIDAGVRGSIGVGLTKEQFILNRKPGWEEDSYGYHSDGKKYTDGTKGENYGPAFTTGDTVGCGINYDKQEIFFTLNGHYLGPAFKKVTSTYYPTVGLHSNGEIVRANFGQNPFKFNIEEMIINERERKKNEILSIEVPISSVHQIIRNFLLHFGYGDTLRAFEKACELKPDNSRADESALYQTLDHRKKLRDLIMSGDVVEAIELTKKLFPDLLEKSPHLLFFLQCQQFIEMIKQKKIEEAVHFAQTILSKYSDNETPENITFLKDCCALLCFHEPQNSPVGHLLLLSQRENVADKLNAAIIERVSTASKLETLLRFVAVAHQTIREANGNKGEIFSLSNFISKGEPF
jgi:hypothetical protein